jgi:hypothetical protein
VTTKRPPHQRGLPEIDPETSALAPGLHTGSIGPALAELRRVALLIDAVTRSGNPDQVKATRARVSAALAGSLRYFRRGVALAELALEGRDPEIAAVYLLLDPRWTVKTGQ